MPDGDVRLLSRIYATRRISYNAFGNIVEESYLDERGNVPTIARKTITYDLFNREIERQFFDGSGELVDGTGGVAVVRIEYDASGRLVAERCLDRNGKLATQHGVGWALHTVTYAERERKDAYTDANGRSVTPPPP